MYVYVGVDTRWYRHLSHLGLEAMQQKHESHATDMKHRHGDPISRLSGLWTDSATCTPIFLSGTSEPLAEQHWGYPCRTGKSRPCAWSNMMSAEGQTCSLGCTNILQNASTCINMHRNGEIEQGDIKAHSSSFLSSLMFHGNLCFFFSAASQIGAQIRRGAAASIAGHPSGPRRGEALVLRGASDKNPLGQTSGSRDKMIRWWTDECVYAYILLHT